MQAIIFGAGRGSRLAEYTTQYSKPFVEVGNRPILQWQLDSLSTICDDVLLVLGYGFEKVDDPRDVVEKHVNIPSSIKLSLLILDDWNEYENAGSCYHAIESEHVSTENDLLLLCGDVIFASEMLTNFKEKATNNDGEFSYVFTIPGIQDEMTSISVGKNGNIIDYGTIEGEQEAGIFYLSSTHVEDAINILSNNKSEWFPIVFPKVQSKPFYIDSYKHAEINKPEHLQNAEKTVVENLKIDITD